jgi:hypothetical protein
VAASATDSLSAALAATLNSSNCSSNTAGRTDCSNMGIMARTLGSFILMIIGMSRNAGKTPSIET